MEKLNTCHVIILNRKSKHPSLYYALEVVFCPDGANRNKQFGSRGKTALKQTKIFRLCCIEGLAGVIYAFFKHLVDIYCKHASTWHQGQAGNTTSADPAAKRLLKTPSAKIKSKVHFDTNRFSMKGCVIVPCSE